MKYGILILLLMSACASAPKDSSTPLEMKDKGELSSECIAPYMKNGQPSEEKLNEIIETKFPNSCFVPIGTGKLKQAWQFSYDLCFNECFVYSKFSKLTCESKCKDEGDRHVYSLTH